jgi:RNA polymerase sigma factor (TIGR02999 family)
MGEVTRLLRQASAGDRESFDALVPLVYDELRRIASRQLAGESAGHTLTPTALVHEAYVQLADQERTAWQSRSHFYAIAALAMRRILINYANGRSREKRGGGVVPVDIEVAERLGQTPILPMDDAQSDALIALDAALTRLGEFNREGAAVIEYHFFGGLTFDGIAEVMGVSEVTVRRRWTAARAWLRRELRPATT